MIFEVMRDKKQIKINHLLVDEARRHEIFKKTFRRYETGFEDDRLPAAQKRTPSAGFSFRCQADNKQPHQLQQG
jgi:hypothetical protein